MYNKVKVTLGIIAGVLGFAGLIVGLGAIVASDNNDDCKKIGLKGSITSCKVDNKYAYDKVVLLVGNTANSPAPKLSEKDKKYLLNSYFKNRNNDEFKVDIYSATPGMPKIQYRVKSELEEGAELAQIVEYYSKLADGIDDSISTAPTEDGANYYDAIIKLGKKLSNERENGEKTLLIVMGSGLSDAGTLNFALNSGYGINKSKAEEIINGIDRINKISEEVLTGTTVVWSYIGQVAYPQTELPNNQVENLKNIYGGLLDRMDAKKVIFDESDNDSRKSVETNFKVQTTPIADATLSWGTQTLGEDIIAFDADSSVIKNPTTANSKLSELARELNSDKRKTVVIESFQARLCSDNESVNEDLLLRRANAVKSILNEQGVTNQIIVKSGGFGSSACTNAADRKVIISVR